MKLAIRIFAALAAVCLAMPAFATVPAGYIWLSASRVQDSTGTLIGNATASFCPVNNSGTPLSFQVAGLGPASQRCVTALITNGVLSTTAGNYIQLADSALTIPVNLCFALTVTDNVSGQLLIGPGFTCLQPSGFPASIATSASWCTAGSLSGPGGTCDLDLYQPNLSALVMSVAGPTGPQGPAGVVNVRGAWAASTAYAKGDAFYNGGNLYIVQTAYTSGGTFGSTDTSNSSSLATGCSTAGCAYSALPTAPGNPTTNLQFADKQYVDAGDATNAAAVTTEATARATGDATNATAVTTEATARAAGDATNATAVTTEATARAAGDATNAAAAAAAQGTANTDATAITAEVTRAEGAEALLLPQIGALSLIIPGATVAGSGAGETLALPGGLSLGGPVATTSLTIPNCAGEYALADGTGCGTPGQVGGTQLKLVISGTISAQSTGSRLDYWTGSTCNDGKTSCGVTHNTPGVVPPVVTYGGSTSLGGNVANSGAYYSVETVNSNETDILATETIGNACTADHFKREVWWKEQTNGASIINDEYDVYRSCAANVYDTEMWGWQCSKIGGYWEYDNEGHGWIKTTIPCAEIPGHIYHTILWMHADPPSSTACAGAPCHYWDSFTLTDVTAGTTNTYSFTAAQAAAYSSSTVTYKLPDENLNWGNSFGAQWQVDCTNSGATGGSPVTCAIETDSDTIYAYKTVITTASLNYTENKGDLFEIDYDGSDAAAPVATGSVTVEALDAYTAPNAANFTNISSFDAASFTSAATSDCRAAVKINAQGSTNERLVGGFNGSSELFTLYLNGVNTFLEYNNDATSSQTTCASAALSSGTAHILEWNRIAGTSGSFAVKIDGVQTCSVTGVNTGTAGLNKLEWGQVSAASTGWDITFDNVGCDDGNTVSGGWLGGITFNSTAAVGDNGCSTTGTTTTCGTPAASGSGSVQAASYQYNGSLIVNPLSSPVLVIPTPAGAPSTTGGSLAAGTTYAMVVALDASGNTSNLGPQGSATTTGSTGSILWTWAAVPNAVSYQLWVGTTSGEEFWYFPANQNSYLQTIPATSATNAPVPFGALNPVSLPSSGTYLSGGTFGANYIGSLTLAGIYYPGSPTGSANSVGGTVASGNNYAIIVAFDYGGGYIVGNESAVVPTTGSNSSITWTWTPSYIGAAYYVIAVGSTSGGETNCFVAPSLSAPYATPSFVQTLPISSGYACVAPTPGASTTGVFAGNGSGLFGTAPAFTVGRATTLTTFSAHTLAVPLACSDTSGSGTAQSCTTSTTFTPATGDCLVYSTTTANTGAGLTLNVNGHGAKSVAKWLGVTTLAAGDVPANENQLACFNGTVWNLMTIGNPPSGGSMVYPSGTGIPQVAGGTSWGTTLNASNPIPANFGGTGEAGTVTGIAQHNGTGADTQATGHQITAPLLCSDSSGSGTAQTCTTSPSFTPASGDCVIYTTTHANSGAGLTLNVNSQGAKSVAKYGGNTTLVAGDVAAGQATTACYNGTVWNLATVANAPPGTLLASFVSTQQTANVSATALTTGQWVSGVNTTPYTGRYTVCMEGVESQAATTSSTMPSLHAKWTSSLDSVASTDYNLSGSGGNSTGNATTIGNGECATVGINSGSTIQYDTTSYASSGATAMGYIFAIYVYTAN